MARIYLNLPCSTSNGKNAYSIWKWLFMGLVLLILLFVVVPFPSISKSLYSSHVNEISAELHYGIVIDCGSSGSRVYVYFWPSHSGNPKDLLRIQQLHDEKGEAVVKKVSPGISSFENNPDAASDHIKELLLFAAQYIPEEKHAETCLHVMATAGMRMLPESAQKAILEDLKRDVKKDFKFIAPDNHFEVITGKQEGVYAWVAINYVLDRFSHSALPLGHDTVSIVHNEKSKTVTHTRKRTVGIIDMGGGSVQIAFEVTDQDQIKNIPSPLISEINLGCQDSDLEHSYKIYVTTFLGYGANSARERYENMLIQETKSKSQRITEDGTIRDVCLPPGMSLSGKDALGHQHQFLGTGDFSACETALEPLMNLTEPCLKSPCSINGIHQPRIDMSSQFYGFSEFWYSTEDVFKMGGLYDYWTFQKKAKDFCSTPWNKLQGWYKDGNYPKADEHRFRFQCFKSAWMAQIFHRGFSFPTSFKHLVSAQLVNGKDVGWTLGALIYKTRFLPLRDIEHTNTQMATSWQRASRALDTQFLMAACVIVVLAAIFLYMKHLKWCPRTEDLKRVPSMTYFMTEQDQMEQGVKNEIAKGQSYTI
ncbi:ectonucleoside triphosphate diphosphohydrolase 7 [Plakobranchus ocellatus]|uniref:Ectonucleoside triphosphate diphosphohydrolase 7 n=1 Tax=Plakobranchus ocellatus TaxID=259542 RepID=A0AAV4DAK0_9GAST|nr:ectonucleoside triphosphate diphosphohydrolase 7 [Plakobranchus ocellatus]